MSSQRSYSSKAFFAVIPLGILGLLQSCAPAANRSSSGEGGARISFVIDRSKLTRESGLSAGGGTQVTLPNEYCYAIHVVADDLRKISAADMPCGAPEGVGVLSPRAYNVGDTAEMEVKVGDNRRFDLIGFSSPAGLDGGRAKCGALTTEFMKGATPIGDRWVLRLDGKDVESHPILFASAVVSVSAGDNVVNLSAVPKVDSSLTSQLAFGGPYLKQDSPNPPEVCVPPKKVLSANQLFMNSGAGIAAPLSAQSSSGRVLQFVTGRPEVFMRVGFGSSQPSTNSTKEVATGLAEIVDRREGLR